MVLGVALAFGAVPACGPAPKVCGPSSCEGCCDEGGECHAGTGLLECGGGGEACQACQPSQVCHDALCGTWEGGDYDGSFLPDPDSGLPRGDGGKFFLDGGLDAGFDGGLDAGRPDGGLDAGFDAGVDAGKPDAGFDAGFDAGVDAGTDAGSSDAGDGG